MKLIDLLISESKNVIIKAAFFGAVSGFVSSGLIVLVHLQLENIDDLSLTLPVIFGFACFLRVITGFYSQLILIRIGQNAIYDLRMKLSRSILSAPLIYLEKTGSAKLNATLIDDINSIAQTLIIVPLICVNIALIAGCLFYLGYLSILSLAFCAVFVIFWFLSVHFISKSAAKYLDSARTATDRLFDGLNGLTEGIKELKLSRERREVFWSKQLESSAAELKKQTIKAEIVYTLAANWSRLIIFILVGILLFLLIRVTRTDSGTVSGVMLTLLFIMSQLDIILNQLPQLGRAETALRKIYALEFSLEKTDKDTTFLKDFDTQLSETEFLSLELCGLSHKYFSRDEEKSFALSDIDLKIDKGELVYIVGGNGSGKTTLAKLILGLYAPENGEIYWNGKIVSNENREDFRENFAAVFADFHLFADLPCELEKEKAEFLLQKLKLAAKVEIKQGRFSTLELSQGQKKRLALLAAYAQDKPVFLFDEWAADQDPIFKEVFYCQLLPEIKRSGKTAIVITHDDKYFHLADRLIKIENGSIISNVSQTTINGLGKITNPSH